jgi:hypothetical protein
MVRRLVFFMVLGLGLLSAKTLLLLPVQGDFDKSADFSTISDLYREAIQNGYKGSVKAPQDSAYRCGERACAIKLATQDSVDEVVFSLVKRLGSKWIFSSTIMRANGNDNFNQRGTAVNIEDLEPVTQRVSDAILNRRSFQQVATVDNITAKEENNEPTRRKSLFTSGFSLGYMYPTGGSFSYLKINADQNGYHESQPYSQMIRMAWLNAWEFRDNMMLGFDASWNAPNVVGGDISLKYLFSKTDYAPFLGGGLGIQYVGNLDDSAKAGKRNSGPALNMQGGMVFFRTYDIHLVTRAQYQVIFNSDIDNGLGFDVGLVYRPKDKQGSGNGWSTFWTYYLVGAIVLSVVGAAAK